MADNGMQFEMTGIHRHPSANWITIDEDVVICDSRTGDTHVLTGGATTIWQLLDGSPATELALNVEELFNRKPELASRDVEGVLAQLRAAGLITEVSGE